MIRFPVQPILCTHTPSLDIHAKKQIQILFKRPFTGDRGEPPFLEA